MLSYTSVVKTKQLSFQHITPFKGKTLGWSNEALRRRKEKEIKIIIIKKHNLSSFHNNSINIWVSLSAAFQKETVNP